MSDPGESFEDARPVTVPVGRESPSSEEAEQHVLAACMADPATLDKCMEARLSVDSFFFPANARIYQVMLRRHTAKEEFDFPMLGMEMGAKDGEMMRHLMQISDCSVSGLTHRKTYIAKVRDLATKREVIRLATSAVEQAYNGVAASELLQNLQQVIEPLTTGHAAPSKAEASARLESRRITSARAPTEPTTRLFLAGKPVATPGNLVTVIAKSKTGKTAAIGATVAAIIGATTGRTDLDTFGFTSPKPEGAVVHIDTEQSPYDAFLCYQRTLARAETQNSDPAWLCHYALVGYGVIDLKAAITMALESASKTHGAIFELILDGVADLVASVNDEAECNALVSWLRSLAVTYACPIICVIHSNEAIKSGDDGRGHLGKQLTRKAESNLLLRKSGEITIITSEKQRKAPITEQDGIAFRWSAAEQRHVSCGTVADDKLEAKRDRSHELASEVFEHLAKPACRYAELIRTIAIVRNVGASRAEDRFTEMKKLGVITKDIVGNWAITP